MSPRSVTLAVFAVCLGLAGCGDAGTAASTPAPRRVLTTVAERATTSRVSFAGVVEPRYQTALGFETLGRIIRRSVGVGDRVRAGDVLVRLDPTPYEQAVRASGGALEAAVAQAENAAATDVRRQELATRNAVSVSDADAARLARSTSASAATRARADLTRAYEQLARADLTARTDGVVTAVEAEVGQVVAAGRTVLRVARTDALEAVVDVPPGLAGELAPGTTFDVSLQLLADLKVQGTVREIAPSEDPSTRTRRIRLALSDPPPDFRIGTTVTATLERPVPAFVELPLSALLERDGETRVWTVDPTTGVATTRPVRVGSRDTRTVRVLDGLAGGEIVVTAGVHGLTEGEKVALAQEATK